MDYYIRDSIFEVMQPTLHYPLIAAQDVCRFASRQKRWPDIRLAGWLLSNRGSWRNHRMALQIFAATRIQRRCQVKDEVALSRSRFQSHRDQGRRLVVFHLFVLNSCNFPGTWMPGVAEFAVLYACLSHSQGCIRGSSLS